MGDRAVLLEAAEVAGLDRLAVEASLASGFGRAEVLAEDAAVRRAGVQGVPTFALNDYVLFSGAVPADTFAEALARAHRVLLSRTG